MRFQEMVYLLDTTSDDKDLQRFVTRKWIELYDESGDSWNVNKGIRIKTPMIRSDLCDFSYEYIVVKGDIAVTEPNNDKRTKALHLKIMHHLSTVFQRSMVYKSRM